MMEKEQLKAIADEYFAQDASVNKVLVTPDGQLFLPEMRYAAENHIRTMKLTPPECFEFTRPKPEKAEDVIKPKKTQTKPSAI